MMFAVLLLAVATVHGSEYVTYEPGTLPLVITAPHGGSLNPSNFPERSIDTEVSETEKYCGYKSGDESACKYDHQYDDTGACDSNNCKVSYKADSYTSNVASGLAAKIEELTQKKPFLVKLEIKRSKVDGNREREEATFGDSKAEAVYDEYMDAIIAAKTRIEKGLLLDIHGMTHAHGMVELGYALSGSDLDCGFSCFDTNEMSIGALINRSCDEPGWQACAEDILRGNKSLGHFLYEQGFPVMPSPSKTSPDGEDYYSGGYTVRTFRSMLQGQFDAIQIEIPRDLRFDSALREPFIEGLASAVVRFIKMYYGLDLPQLSGTTTSPSTTPPPTTTTTAASSVVSSSFIKVHHGLDVSEFPSTAAPATTTTPTTVPTTTGDATLSADDSGAPVSTSCRGASPHVVLWGIAVFLQYYWCFHGYMSHQP